MAESVLLNPNSYENIEHILQSLKCFSKIGSDREWVFIGCDGPLYCLVERTIERNPEKFDYVSTVPGLGHLHMNQMKTLFKILDPILLEPLGKDVLKFQSPNAYQFFVDAKDTHKSFQSLQILLFGTALELIRAYKSDIGTDKCSAMGFLKWQAEHNNSTIQLINQLIFTYTLAVYFFKIGVRRNDVSLINAARHKFNVLFFSFNHPYYREVEYRDFRDRVLYHPEVRQLRDRNMSFSESSVLGKSQGGDFLLEQKVKRQKLIAPKGPIKGETWKMLSRCLDEFNAIYTTASSQLNLKDPDSENIIDLVDEISSWRAVLRISNYLNEDNYSEKPKSIYGDILSSDMIDFTAKAESKREAFLKLLENGSDIVSMKYNDFLQVLPDTDIDELLYSDEEF